MTTGWEDRAQKWLQWARTPGHDAYWQYRDAFFALLPRPGAATLEVGCGEGRVSRDLAACGHRVSGIDASPTLVDAATALDPAGDYRLAAAEELPFGDASFDLAVAYNSLMDVADMPCAVAEIGRVVKPGGHFAACITHPLADAGGWEDGRFVIDAAYLEARTRTITIERGGLAMTFDGAELPLQAYATALEDAGFAIEAIREPKPRNPPFGDQRWSRIPMFLMWRARK